jgi:acyl-CoA hydrolase
MKPSRLDLSDLASVLPKGGRVLIGGCSGESLALADAVMRAGEDLGAMTFTGIFVPGLNKNTYLANPACRVETFFLTPELKAVKKSVHFLPFCYADILAHLTSVQIDAALFMATPPDVNGVCGFGPIVDFLAELWPRIPVRVAHVNLKLPRVASACGVPFEELTAYIEGDQELLGFDDAADDALSAAIGAHVGKFIGDGATLQTGLGKIPTAVIRVLRDRRGLRVHSGLVPEAVCDLEDAGALASGVAVTGGVAIGSRRLYDRVKGDAYRFEPVSYTHSTRVIAGLDNPVSINSALEVDLFGQCYSEMTPGGLMSGPGGASDFARGVKVAGGLRIVALAATAAKGKITRIVAPGRGSGPASLSRFDTDIVVTEHGAADLRGIDHHERARALISIAAPEHQPELSDLWSVASARF